MSQGTAVTSPGPFYCGRKSEATGEEIGEFAGFWINIAFSPDYYVKYRPIAQGAGFFAMPDPKRYDEFAHLVRLHSRQVLAYIGALVLNWSDADDLFQETCLVLWQKFDDFEPGTNFLAWALRTADFQVMKFRTRQAQLTAFTARLRDAMMADISVRGPTRRRGLGRSPAAWIGWPPSDREMVTQCYGESVPVRRLADELGRSPQSVHHSLCRIRKWLLDCVRRELRREDSPGEKKGTGPICAQHPEGRPAQIGPVPFFSFFSRRGGPAMSKQMPLGFVVGTVHNVVGDSFQNWSLSYLVAASGQWSVVSGQSAANPQSPISNQDLLVPVGAKYSLASGFMEITYDSGAKVILQGPCTYEVESALGGFLSVGKLTARVEKGREERGEGREAAYPNPRPKTQLPGSKGERTVNLVLVQEERKPTTSLAPRPSLAQEGEGDYPLPLSPLLRPYSHLHCHRPGHRVRRGCRSFGRQSGTVFRGNVEVREIAVGGKQAESVRPEQIDRFALQRDSRGEWAEHVSRACRRPLSFAPGSSLDCCRAPLVVCPARLANPAMHCWRSQPWQTAQLSSVGWPTADDSARTRHWWRTTRSSRPAATRRSCRTWPRRAAHWMAASRARRGPRGVSSARPRCVPRSELPRPRRTDRSKPLELQRSLFRRRLVQGGLRKSVVSGYQGWVGDIATIRPAGRLRPLASADFGVRHRRKIGARAILPRWPAHERGQVAAAIAVGQR